MFDFIGFVVLGGLTGWVAGRMGRGGAYGQLFDVMLGMAGGISGGWLIGAVLGTLGHMQVAGFLSEFLVGVAAACGLVAALHLLMRTPVRT